MNTSSTSLLLSFLLIFECECKSDYMVEHSLSISGSDDDMIWNNRGRLIIDDTSRSGSLSIHDWSDNEIDEWNELIKSENSFYKLRIKISDKNYLIASVLTCQLNRGGDERIILHSDYDGNLIGFDYYTSNPSCSDYYGTSPKSKKKNKKKKSISSSVILPKSLQKTVEVSMSFGDKGDSPYMAEYEISPPKKDQPSFWSRYWWIILIVGFVIVQSIAAGAAGQ